MIVALQSMDKFDSIAILDSDTGQISWRSRAKDSLARSHPIQGSIAKVQDRTLCLYRKDQVLHFRVDNDDFELTEGTQIELARVDEEMNRITVLHNGNGVFAWVYRRPMIDPPLENDLTPFIEEEHFDFCLFVYNVATDPARRARIYA